MPTVPYAKEKVTPTALPGPRIGGSAGSDMFAGNERLGEVARQIVLDEQNKINQIAVMDADRAASELEIKLQYAPELGFSNRRGKDAMGIADEYMVNFKSGLDDIASTLTNQVQRDAFALHVNNRMGSFQAKVEHHAFSEGQRYDIESTNAYVGNNIDEIGAVAGAFVGKDPVARKIALSKIDTARDRIVGAILDMAIRNGKSMEWAKLQIQEKVSTAHLVAVERMLANEQDQVAQGYYNKYSKEFTAKDSVAVERALNEGTRRGQEQRMTDYAMGKFGTWEERLAWAKTIADPKIRDGVTQRLKNEINTDSVIQAKWREDVFKGASEAVTKSGSVDSVPPSMWVSMTAEQRSSLESLAKHIRAGTEPKNDPEVWLNFLATPPSELAKMSQADVEVKFRAHLDHNHYGRVIQAWNTLHQTDPSKMSPMLTDGQIVKNAYAKVIEKPDYKKWSKDEKLDFLQFEHDASAAIHEFEITNKQKATDEQKAKIINDKLLQKVFVERSMWFDKEKLKSSVTPDERGRVYVPLEKIPAKDRNDLINYARSIGAIDLRTDRATAERILKDRLQKAYGAYVMGASRDAIRDILKGGR